MNLLDSKSVISYCFLKKQPLLKVLFTKLKRSSNIQVTIIRYYEIMRYTVTQFARESVGLCPFRSSYVREFDHTVIQ